jgi:hypothetical protein
MGNMWHKTGDMNLIKACLSGKTPKDNASANSKVDKGPRTTNGLIHACPKILDFWPQSIN